MEIRFGLNEAEYRIEGEGWNPLPWGEFKVESARVTGRLYSSRGGAWYWRLPQYTVVGYGRYNPTAIFYFSGKIRVEKGKVLEERDFEGSILRQLNGMRIGDRKIIVFEGAFSPSETVRLEGVLKRYLTPEFINSVKSY
jgi:hypothetical protein